MSDDQSDDPRRQRVLDAALGVFGRYGFRKASMEDVARAADLSRQALYLRYPTKEALFRGALGYMLDTAAAAAAVSFGDGERPFDARLAGAFDAWMGPAVGMLSRDAVDLMETSAALAGPAVAEHEGRFLDAVIKAIRGSGLVAAYALPGLTARQLATTFYATAKGLKYIHSTRAEFAAELALAARVLCAPLRPS